MPSAPPTPTGGGEGIYNPSGHWSAYDTNVYESLNFPGRQAGDTTSNDAPGTGDPRFGFCPPQNDPTFMPQGKCANHALEYLDYYEKTMRELLKDVGGTVHRYEFTNPGRSDTGGNAPEPGGLSSPGGQTFNIAGIVPGADNPGEEVIVSGHWDFTDAAPAAAWDSAEGHTEVIRAAKIMVDYWKRTGTRPSATVKFMPWAAEESGTYGSADYVAKHIVEGEASRIRGYFNMDPCAGAYPAFYHGNPQEQVPMVLQVADPAADEEPDKTKAFNDRMVKVIDEFWEDVDDTVDTAAGPKAVFTPADRGKLVVALGGLAAFSSDYRNFDDLNIPIVNLFPDMFGPHADGTPASSEGAGTIHTPRDHLQTLNQMTSADQTGLSASDGWMTGMELCSNLEARMMLEPNMGGAQVANLDPVAYFEALPFPNGILKGKLATFDASGSYQYGQLATRQYTPESDLRFKWDFGDNSPAAFGKVVKHAYKSEGIRKVTLTVTNRKTGQSDTAVNSVFVAEGTGDDKDPSDQTRDPGLAPAGSPVACQSSAFASLKISPAGKGLRAEGTGKDGGSFLVEVFKVGKAKAKKVTSFTVNGSATWDGKGATKGEYLVRATMRGKGPRPDVRGFAFSRGGKAFKARKPFQRPDTCGDVTLFRLTTPAFGGRTKLGIALALAKPGKVDVRVLKGRKLVKRFRKSVKEGNRLVRFTLSPKKLRKGEYKVILKAAGRTETLYAKRV
jgi:hypothetical protein